MELSFTVPSGCIRFFGTTVLVTYASLPYGKSILNMFYAVPQGSVRFLAVAAHMVASVFSVHGSFIPL